MSRLACGAPAASSVATKSARSAPNRGPSPARITRTLGTGGSTSRLNGTPSATPSDQSVSMLGLPVPASSWESVDFATPARRASSAIETPTRARSRRRAAAMVASGGEACCNVRSIGSFVRFDEQYSDRSACQTMRTAPRTADRALLRDAVAIAAAMVAVGASFGAITIAYGLPTWVPFVMSTVVFAGGAQFLAVGLIAAGNPIAAVLAGLLLNARHLPFGLAVAETVGPRRRDRFVGSHLMTDEVVAFTLRERDPAR